MILDSNIVIGLLDPLAPDTLFERIAELRQGHSLCINEIVFAELASGYPDIAEQQAMLTSLDLRVERMPIEACHRAGAAFAEYKRRSGSKPRMLPDFLIGAHAVCAGHDLVTRDRRSFASYFPELTIIDPMEDIE